MWKSGLEIPIFLALMNIVLKTLNTQLTAQRTYYLVEHELIYSHVAFSKSKKGLLQGGSNVRPIIFRVMMDHISL